MEELQLGNHTVAYERQGNGPALVFLHGALDDSRGWRYQLTALADEFTVVAWDAPGAGNSTDPPEPYGLADYADILSDFISALELSPAHVAGISWGGTLAQEFYRRHPEQVRSLILADTYAGWTGSLGEKAVLERLDACLKQSTMAPEEFIPGWIPGLLTDDAPSELVDEMISIMSDFHPAGFRLMARSMLVDEHDLLPRIRVPTLLIWGEDDLRSPLRIGEEFRDAIPGAKLVVIAGAGHMTNVQQPDLFNAAVREFCQAVV